jgi:hypothetical protein
MKIQWLLSPHLTIYKSHNLFLLLKFSIKFLGLLKVTYDYNKGTIAWGAQGLPHSKENKASIKAMVRGHLLVALLACPKILSKFLGVC